ncbi:MAG: ribose 5-phosphate isomerase B [Elusimicrobiales bacterium]|jgi:ribose 5-phosphate isomerase B|nr:ribose 5-phosphate isomerase B [Elusimicrobiales bacterium]
MKIAIASDHAGFPLKAALIHKLKMLGHEISDLGTNSPNESVDYPDFAAAVARAVAGGQARRGIVVCGSGVGACVAANKFKGVRAGLCHDTYSAHQGVEHDDVNVLCLGARIIGESLALEVASAFLGAEFSNEERHVRRLNKVKKFEEGLSS